MLKGWVHWTKLFQSEIMKDLLYTLTGSAFTSAEVSLMHCRYVFFLWCTCIDTGRMIYNLGLDRCRMSHHCHWCCSLGQADVVSD